MHSEHRTSICFAEREQECIRRRNPAYFPFLLPPDGQFLLLILQDLLFLATGDRNCSEEDVDIDLYKGILTTVLEHPLILHCLTLFRGWPGITKSPFTKR